MASSRETEIRTLFDRRRRAHLRSLIDVDIVDEYKASPDGPHSDRLARVLRYFRAAPIEGKLAVCCLGPDRFRLCRARLPRGAAPVLEGPVFGNEKEAVIAIFEDRLARLMAT